MIYSFTATVCCIYSQMQIFSGDNGQSGMCAHHLPDLPPLDGRAWQGGRPPLPCRVRPRGSHILELQQQPSDRRERGREGGW